MLKRLRKEASAPAPEPTGLSHPGICEEIVRSRTPASGQLNDFLPRLIPDAFALKRFERGCQEACIYSRMCCCSDVTNTE